MQSQIAAYRFVHLRGLWYARPLHPGDAGPVVADVRDVSFCEEPAASTSRRRASDLDGAVAPVQPPSRARDRAA